MRVNQCISVAGSSMCHQVASAMNRAPSWRAALGLFVGRNKIFLEIQGGHYLESQRLLQGNLDCNVKNIENVIGFCEKAEAWQADARPGDLDTYKTSVKTAALGLWASKPQDLKEGAILDALAKLMCELSLLFPLDHQVAETKEAVSNVLSQRDSKGKGHMHHVTLGARGTP
jgi:hypothetical protein